LVFNTFFHIVDHCWVNSPVLRGHLAVCHSGSKTFYTCVFHRLPFCMNSFRSYIKKYLDQHVHLNDEYKNNFYLATTLTSPRSTQSALDSSVNWELSNSFMVDTAMLQCQSRLYLPIMGAAPFSLCTDITEIQVCHQMFHFYADSTGVHTEWRGPCPDQDGMKLSPTLTFKGQIITNGDSGQNNSTPTVTGQTYTIVRRRSVKNWWLLTMDLNQGTRRIDFERRTVTYEGSKCRTKKRCTDRLENGRAQHTLESRNTCFVRWTFIIYRIVFVYSPRTRTHSS